MFNNPLAKDLCVDINADIYSKQAHDGSSHCPGKQGFKGFRAGLSGPAAAAAAVAAHCALE